MFAKHIPEYIAASLTSEHPENEQFTLFTDALRVEFFQDMDSKKAAIEAEYQAKLAALKQEREQREHDMLNVSRFRNTASRINNWLNNPAQNCPYASDLAEKINAEIGRLAHNCDVDLDLDVFYKALFSKTFMPELEQQVETKADYESLVQKTVKSVHLEAIRDQYRVIQETEYGENYAERINEAFVLLQNEIEKRATMSDLSEDDITGQALSSFGIMGKADTGQKWFKALHKIAVNNILVDIEKFDLAPVPNINPELIEHLKAIKFDTSRFKQAGVCDRAEVLSELQGKFIAALENDIWPRKISRDMQTIGVELRSSAYTVHNPL